MLSLQQRFSLTTAPEQQSISSDSWQRHGAVRERSGTLPVTIFIAFALHLSVYPIVVKGHSGESGLALVQYVSEVMTMIVLCCY